MLNLTLSNGVQWTAPLTKVETVPLPPLWMHLEDKDARGYIRSCAPCPAVWVLKDDPHAMMGEQWQYFLRAINYNMTMENVYLILDDHLAWANRTGFPSLDNPGERCDYFFRRNLAGKPPALDKVRTASRNVMTGTEAYSLIQAFREVFTVAKEVLKRTLIANRRRAFIQAATAENVLIVTTLDSRANPPLKPGRSYPSRVEDANIDDYLYTPRTHPWFFVVANIVNKAGEVVQFPRGGLYDWTGDNTPRTFLPLVSNHGWGTVSYPLRYLRRLAVGEAVPRPYRSN